MGWGAQVRVTIDMLAVSRAVGFSMAAVMLLSAGGCAGGASPLESGGLAPVTGAVTLQAPAGAPHHPAERRSFASHLLAERAVARTAGRKDTARRAASGEAIW
ncbi:MAG: hypothetical protein AAGG99_08420 [Pseudomonadota bacterium]